MPQASEIASRPTFKRAVQLSTIASASAPSVIAPKLTVLASPLPRTRGASSRTRASRGRPVARAPRSPDLDDDRQNGNDAHADDCEPEVLLHDRLIAEEVAEQAEAPHPREPAADVESEEPPVEHPA